MAEVTESLWGCGVCLIITVYLSTAVMIHRRSTRFGPYPFFAVLLERYSETSMMMPLAMYWG